VSVPVLLDDLKARLDEFGSVAFLVTTNDDQSSHVVSAVVEIDGDALVVPVGRTTRANASRRPTVSVLWPPDPGGAFSLIVDGTATTSADDGPLHVIPKGAILHRMAGRTDEGPTCLPVSQPAV